MSDNQTLIQMIAEIRADPKDQARVTAFYLLVMTISKRMITKIMNGRGKRYDLEECSRDVACMYYEQLFFRGIEVKKSAPTMIWYLCRRRMEYRRMCEMEGSLDEYTAARDAEQ